MVETIGRTAIVVHVIILLSISVLNVLVSFETKININTFAAQFQFINRIHE